MSEKETQKTEDKYEKLFGVSKESIDKSKDIKDVLDLSKFQKGSKFRIMFLESEPKEVNTPSSMYQKTSNVIKVEALTTHDGICESGKEYSMFLSSKSLALGVGSVYTENDDTLINVIVEIEVSEAMYKDPNDKTGKKKVKNTCYKVTQIFEE